MEKKNYNLEIFFESQKKSFVILSKNKITFDEVKQKTMREFRIPKEYEKDMKFSITSKSNRQTTISKDYQILSNFEEMSKNNYYLKIIFNLNNNNYVYQSVKVPLNKANMKIRIYNANQFSIISKKNNSENNNKNIDEKKYKDEIKKLKEEIEKLKNEKYIKGDIDIRKFDEKYRDLSNKNNILEQKITELENENKTLKIGHLKNINNDNFLENSVDGDPIVKEIEKIFTKLMGEHEDIIIKEINGLKNTVGIMQKEQKKIYDKLNGTQRKENNEDNIDDDDNFEILKEDKIIDIINNNDAKKIQNKINKINIIKNNFNSSAESENVMSEKNNINNTNTNIINDNFDDLDNFADIIIDNKDEDKKNSNNIQSIDNKSKENSKEINSNKPKNLKKITLFEIEDEKNSKMNNDSQYKIIKKPEKNIIKEIQDSFLDNNNNNNNSNMLSKNISNDINKKVENNYSKYTAPPKNKIVEKMKKKKKFLNKNNYSNINNNYKNIEQELINYESSSEINADTKRINDNHNKINSSNSHKNFLIKIEDKRKSNNISKYIFNDKSLTPSGPYISEREKLEKEKNNLKKNELSITPGNNNKTNNVRENIENYFINLFQNIFFYGSNVYMNILKISDKLLKKLRDGVMKYRMNINEVKDYTIKYISYSIIPIVNDSNTKEYQRTIIKNKITTILECVNIDKNYFDKEYKEIKEGDEIKNYEDKNVTGVNITHTKINDFRKFYELKEKDYPDELIMKALIRYRGNRELAFQYLFY